MTSSKSNMSRRTICVVTGSRAEYGLLFWLLKEIQEDIGLNLKLMATGSHLSPEYGYTFKEIEKDGFTIDTRVEMLVSSNTSTGTAKSVGLGIIGFADAYAALKPDLITVVGDRFEILAAVSAALVMRIPVAHIHGGETTEGAFDEGIRHAVTKMSHLHFAATAEYRDRIIQMGEDPDHVFNVGGLGIDNIKKLPLMAKDELEKSIGFKFGKKNILVTFHPVTLDEDNIGKQFASLLDVIHEIPELHVLFTHPNADTGSFEIRSMIDEFVYRNQERCVAFASLGQLRYLSALQFIDAVVGNSSSGILEAPSFRIGTINIGDRQKGRIRPRSVIDCGSSFSEIQRAFEILFSPDFKLALKDLKNPYGDGGASKAIKEHLKSTDLRLIIKKHFHDIRIR